jgi:hypothetical protein
MMRKLNLLITFTLSVTLLLIFCGCNEKYYVDKQNITGPWQGTESAPFKTIQAGLDAAGRTDWVLVKPGLYSENLRMNMGTKLGIWPGSTTPPVIDGNTTAPVIRANRNNIINGFIIQGGSQAILLELGNELKTSEREIYINVSNCEIRNTSWGIAVKLAENIDLGSDTDRVIQLIAHHNWFNNLDGGGIISFLNGPSTGRLQISLDVRDNVFQSNFTGITLNAKGSGPNPGGYGRAYYSGYIWNNLIFGGANGILLESENNADIIPMIGYNTIADMDFSGIISSADTGPDGQAHNNPVISSNIFANNQNFGFNEWTDHASPRDLHNNLFYNNTRGHYFDFEANRSLNSQSDLNSIPTNAGNNLVANPLFEDGGFPWRDNQTIYSGAHRYFLQQNGGNISPAVDAGSMTVEQSQLTGRSTKTNLVPDEGIADIGFHYKQP